jgi:cation transport ATPase
VPSAGRRDFDQVLDQVPVKYFRAARVDRGHPDRDPHRSRRADEIVIVPPGEQIPVTGTVIAGHD